MAFFTMHKEENIKGSGIVTRCKGKESCFMPINKSPMKANGSMINFMDLVLSLTKPYSLHTRSVILAINPFISLTICG